MACSHPNWEECNERCRRNLVITDPAHYSVIKETEIAGEAVDHPAHYGGGNNPYEAIKVIEAWDLNFCLGNAVKYISRAGKKDQTKYVEDLEKARWYLDREIATLRAK